MKNSPISKQKVSSDHGLSKMKAAQAYISLNLFNSSQLNKNHNDYIDIQGILLFSDFQVDKMDRDLPFIGYDRENSNLRQSLDQNQYQIHTLGEDQVKIRCLGTNKDQSHIPNQPHGIDLIFQSCPESDFMINEGWNQKAIPTYQQSQLFYIQKSQILMNEPQELQLLQKSNTQDLMSTQQPPPTQQKKARIKHQYNKGKNTLSSIRAFIAQYPLDKLQLILGLNQKLINIQQLPKGHPITNFLTKQLNNSTLRKLITHPLMKSFFTQLFLNGKILRCLQNGKKMKVTDRLLSFKRLCKFKKQFVTVRKKSFLLEQKQEIQNASQECKSGQKSSHASLQ